MNVLDIKLIDNKLVKHYQYGMLKLLSVPVNYGMDCLDNEFFAYISTLGGGLVEGDKYEQNFVLDNTKAVISSQSCQKVYKGKSTLKTKINLANNSKFVFHNDANIFYPNSDFTSSNTIFLDKNSKLFFVDGGFLGYAEGNFRANMQFRLYINSKLALNDVFCYESKNDLQSLYKHEYFYNVIIYDDLEFETIHKPNIKAHASKVNEVIIIRILSDNNGEAIKYMNNIKNSFLTKSNMTLTSTR